MADDTNEDSWLYGTSNPDSTTNEEERNIENVIEAEPILSTKTDATENEAQAADAEDNDIKKEEPLDIDVDADASFSAFEDPAEGMEEDEEAAAAAMNVADTTDEATLGQKLEEQSKSATASDDDDDSDDDMINVVIGDIKAAPSTYNIKQRSNLMAVGQDKSKPTTQGGKFTIEDFEGVGTINGVPAHEFSIDSLEEKPWRKPGADITDYFNYGFNEETWRAYCERQKRIRIVESGVGLTSLTPTVSQNIERPQDNAQPPTNAAAQIAPTNEQPHAPSPGLPQQTSFHGPPIRAGVMTRPTRPVGTKENAIQVMTAECREYSRPGVLGQMPSNFGGPGVPIDEPFFPDMDAFDYGYEPTQESQWGNDNPAWVPTGIKELTPGPGPGPGPNSQMSGPSGQMGVRPPQMGGPPMRVPPLLSGMPPHNMNLGPPPGMGMMMGPNNGPPMRMPMGPPRMMGPPPNSLIDPHERNQRRYAQTSNIPLGSGRESSERTDEERERRRRERERDRERERERPRRERSRSREKLRRRSKSREKERDPRERERDRDRERDKDDKRDKDEKIRRRSKSREKEREPRERERDRERERERDRDSDKRDKEDKRSRRSKSREKRSSKLSRSDKKKYRKDKDDDE